MILTAVLAGILALLVGGYVCVFLASRGGAPRWVRGVATVTLAAGEVAGVVLKSRGSGRRGGGGGGADGDD